MHVFGFTVVWIVRIVHAGCKSFVLGTQLGGGPWGTLVLLDEIVIFIEGRETRHVSLLGKSCSSRQRNSSKKCTAPMLNSSEAINPSIYIPTVAALKQCS